MTAVRDSAADSALVLTTGLTNVAGPRTVEFAEDDLAGLLDQNQGSGVIIWRTALQMIKPVGAY